MKNKVGLISLGCDKNLVDSEYMLGILKKNGYEITNDEKQAEILVINTCGFVQSAKQESIDTILEMGEYKKNGSCKLLIATGCLAQRYKSELLKQMPEIDAVLGTGEFYKINDVIIKLLSEGKKINLTRKHCFLDYDVNNRVRAYPYHSFVKIAEGCNNRCSYCAIPFIKGPYKSRDISSIKAEVKMLVKDGVKEINLIAQDTTSYGIDLFGKPSLQVLLKELIKIEGDFWIRILYAYPTNITDELIEIIKDSPKIVKYLDIPLQHINDRILKLMNRPTDSFFIKSLIEKIRRNIPGITMRTTFIVGLPTETESDFDELLEFIRKYEFEKVGAFKYSQEEGTPAAQLSHQVSEDTKSRRYNELMQVQQAISKNKNRKLEGKKFTVLTESYSNKNNLYIGRTQREAPFVDGVVLFKAKSCTLGEFCKVEIKKAYDYDLFGLRVDEIPYQ